MTILSNILDKSSIDSLKHLENPPFTINIDMYTALFSNIKKTYKIPIEYDLPGSITIRILDPNQEISVLFYYFVYNLFFPKELVHYKNVSDIYILFTILLEKKCTTTMFELYIHEETHNFMEKIINLYSNIDEIFQTKTCDDVNCSAQSEIPQQISAHGGGVRDFKFLEELLRKVLEPRHDFGKSGRIKNQINTLFNKQYIGKYDNFQNYQHIRKHLDDFIKEGNEFYRPANFNLDKIIHDDNFESMTFVYFHNFIKFSEYEENTSPLLYKYLTIKGDDLVINSIYNLKQIDIEKQILNIKVFQDMIFKTNNISYHMDDITPGKEVKNIYSSSMDEIISAASIWDPNSKHTLLPLPGNEKRTPFFESILENTYLNKDEENTPKRPEIVSGKLKLNWGVMFNLERNTFTLQVDFYIDNTIVNEFSVILSNVSIGVDQISRLMNYVENSQIDSMEPNTEIILNSIIIPILEYKTDKVNYTDDKKNILFMLLLDFKLTGDWGQCNWIKNYNNQFPEKKCILITKDKLCALRSILVGNPTLVNNVKTLTETVSSFIKDMVKRSDLTTASEIYDIVNKFDVVLYTGKVSTISNKYINSIFTSIYSKLLSDSQIHSYQPETNLNMYERFISINSATIRENFKYSSIFFEPHLDAYIGLFNADGNYLSSLLNGHPLDEKPLLIRENINDIFMKAKNIDRFSNLIKELDIFLQHINDVQLFLTQTHDYVMVLLGWLTSAQDYDDLYAFIFGDKITSRRRTERLEQKTREVFDILKSIDVGELCDKIQFKYRSGLEDHYIKLCFLSIINLYQKVKGTNIKVLFGSIYSKQIHECSYIPDISIKTAYCTKLYNLILQQPDFIAEDKKLTSNKLIFIVNSLKCIIHNHRIRDTGSNLSKLIREIEDIISQISQFLEMGVLKIF